jgi:hypothetical protein
MLKLDTRADLEALHTGSIQESLTLEYKSSGAVEKTEAKKMEIAKDAASSCRRLGNPSFRRRTRSYRACLLLSPFDLSISTARCFG